MAVVFITSILFLITCRGFHAPWPNQKWGGDISYDGQNEDGYVVLELRPRHVIGWAVSNRLGKNLAIRAFKMAISLR